VVTASFSLLFGHRPSSPKRKEKYQRPSIHFDRRQNWARIISPKSQTNARAPNKQKVISTHHKIIIINITRYDKKNSSAGVVVKK
jgi:hypothetical protein